jgi:cobalt-zinc-cadmium efflux system protein
VLALVSVYIVAEVVGGLLTNSLALLADAGHMLSDAAALGLSLFALWIAERPPSATRTYGYYRTEILAALVNGATLVAIAIYIFIEAVERFREPPEVLGGLMMAIASGGLLVNLVGLWILNAGRGESLNMRGAWLHVFTDALGSVGAIVGGVLIYFFGWSWADPVVSVLIGLLVLYSSWRLLKESVAVLMEGVPGAINVDDVRDAIASVPAVRGVHDLHVWSITSGLVALSAHVVVESANSMQPALSAIQTELSRRFAIEHATIQVETNVLGERLPPV